MKTDSSFSKLLFIVATFFPFLAGGYYVFCTAGIGIVLATALLIHIIKDKNIKLSISYTFLTLLIMSIMYLLTRFWAVDKSMAVHGFIKFFTAFIFSVSLVQIKEEERLSLFYSMPISAVSMTVIGLLAGLSSKGKTYLFDINGDYHSFFQYANSYAIFLLLTVIATIFLKMNVILKIITIAVCSVGLYMSKSRAVWLLCIVTFLILAYYFFFTKISSKKCKVIIFIAFVSVLIIAGLILLKAGYLGKLLNYIDTDKSLNKRYVYYSDSLKYIIKHPFGKGAYAFYFAQPQFQNAFYYAIDVHCDLLQYAIEIGIIPALMFMVLIIGQLLSKNVKPMQKVILFILCIHSLIDYDLQFIYLLFILIMCLDCKNIKEFKISVKKEFLIYLFTCAIILLYTIVGLSAFYNFTGYHKKSVKLYKNTPSMIILMQSSNEKEVSYNYAKEIMQINKCVYEPNNVLSRIYESDQEYEQAVSEMETVLEKDPREIQHYRDYIDLLVNTINYYDERGEEEKSQKYREKIIGVTDRLKTLKENTNERGILYGRKQRFGIGKKYKKIIRRYKY